MEELLTIDELCARFKISRKWVYEHMQELPYTRLGPKGPYRFRESAIQDFIEEHSFFPDEPDAEPDEIDRFIEETLKRHPG